MLRPSSNNWKRTAAPDLNDVDELQVRVTNAFSLPFKRVHWDDNSHPLIPHLANQFQNQSNGPACHTKT
jgi:hypothetical protein